MPDETPNTNRERALASEVPAEQALTEDDRQAIRRGLWIFLGKSLDLSGPVGLALLLSLVVQVGFITYLVLEVPPPPRPTADAFMDNSTIMTIITEVPEPPPPPEDAVEEEDALVSAELPEPEPEPEPEEEEDELEVPDEEPPPEDLEPEVVNLEELEPLEPQALAVEGIGGSDSGGAALPQGSRTMEQAAEAQRRSGGRRRARDTEEQAQPEPSEEREEREPRRPVRLEDAGTPPALRREDPELGYPREFRERALAGRVVVQCIITERGRVRACRHRGGPEELADYVISIVRRWRYDPARDHEDEAVAVFYTFRVPFRLL